MTLRPPHPSHLDILPEIRAGSDIWVVLKNRFGPVNYTESYHLTNIVMAEDRFWGKFREVHAAHGLATMTNEAYDRNGPMAFAYNNFAPMVCSAAMARSMTRFFSSLAYAELRFIASRKYTRLWDWGSPRTDAMAKAVVEGRALKLMLRSADGYFYSIPIHTVEVEANGAFNAYSWFDGYPEALRHFSWAEEFATQLEEVNGKVPDYSSSFVIESPFFYPYFRISSDLGALLIDPKTDKSEPFATLSIEILGEC